MIHAAHGKTFFLDRAICQQARRDLAAKIERRGGSVVTWIDERLDCLVLTEERRATPGQSQPERFAAPYGARITTLYEPALQEFLAPTRAEALTLLNGGAHGAARWNDLLPRDESGIVLDLTGADLSGRNLTDYGFRNCDVTGVNLTGATLLGAGFWHPRLIDFRAIGLHEGLRIWCPVECQFDGLDLPGFYHHGAMVRCSFRGARLPRAHLWGGGSQACDFSAADLTEADLADWAVVELVAEGACLHKAQVRNATLTGARLAGVVLTEANLEDARLSGADLQKANLSYAHLARAKLSGADLRKANLTGANLADADLSNARVAGADFTGANLRGAILDGIPARSATALIDHAAPLRPAGPLLCQFVADLATVRAFDLSFTLAGDESLRYELRGGTQRAGVFLVREVGGVRLWTYPRVVADALLDLATLHPSAKVLLDAIELHPASLGEALAHLAVRAIGEVFGQKARAAKTSNERRDALLAELRHGGDAVARWNARPEAELASLRDFQGADLSRCDLRGINLHQVNVSQANFAGADLRAANLSGGTLRRTSLRDADLQGANLSFGRSHHLDASGADLRDALLYELDLHKAKLRGANLRGANLMRARLQGADLSGADLAGVRCFETVYDDATTFPEGFTPDHGWQHADAPPVVAAKTYPSLDYAAFLKKLPGVVEAARVTAALSQSATVYAEVSDTAAGGVVVCDERAYACRLTANGQYECGTANLRACAGLKGQVCKHVLTLLLRLTQAGELDAGAALAWLRLAKREGPSADRAWRAATFLKYQGVATGDVAWSPLG